MCPNLWAHFLAKGCLMTEAQYQKKLIRKIKTIFPGCVVIKNDSSYQQGFPDWTIFYGEKWATLEVKKEEGSAQRPNQEHFISQLNAMSFSAFIFPENEEEILSEMERAFAS